MSVEIDIREALTRFYTALNRALNGDSAPMLALWSQGPEVSVMHPGGGRYFGWNEVREAWERWARIVTDGHIAAEDIVIRLITADVACVTGVERGGGTLAGEYMDVESRMTLLLRRDGREWHVIHHHVDPAPAVRARITQLAATAGS